MWKRALKATKDWSGMLAMCSIFAGAVYTYAYGQTMTKAAQEAHGKALSQHERSQEARDKVVDEELAKEAKERKNAVDCESKARKEGNEAVIQAVEKLSDKIERMGAKVDQNAESQRRYDLKILDLVGRMGGR